MKKGWIIIGSVVGLLIIGTIVAITYMSSNYIKSMDELVIANVDLNNVKDGKYIGEHSIFPIVVKVEVTVLNNQIKDIKILKHQTGQGEDAEKIVDDVILNQSLDVDTITKATGSSKVILKAIENALTK